MRATRVFIVFAKDEKPSLSKFAIEGVTKKVDLMDHETGLRESISRMLHYDLVVTCGQWHEDERCNQLIDIARKSDMKIIHESRFKYYVKTYND